MEAQIQAINSVHPFRINILSNQKKTFLDKAWVLLCQPLRKGIGYIECDLNSMQINTAKKVKNWACLVFAVTLYSPFTLIGLTLYIFSKHRENLNVAITLFKNKLIQPHHNEPFAINQNQPPPIPIVEMHPKMKEQDPITFDLIKNELEEQLSYICIQEGSWKDLVEKLKRQLGDKKEVQVELEKIKKLQEEREKTKKLCLEANSEKDKLLKIINEKERLIQKVLRESLKSYLYLTEGVGQFEEYEIDINEEISECQIRFHELGECAAEIKELLPPDRRLSFQRDYDIFVIQITNDLKTLLNNISKEKTLVFSNRIEEFHKFLNAHLLIINDSPVLRLSEDKNDAIKGFEIWHKELLDKVKDFAKFGDHLNKKIIVETIENGEISFSSAAQLLQSYNKNCQELKKAVIELDQTILDLNDELASHSIPANPFEELIEVVNSIYQSLDERNSEYEGLRYDEFDSNDKAIHTALKNAIEEFQPFLEELEFSGKRWDSILDSIEAYITLNEKLKGYDEIFVESKVKLIKILNNLKSPLIEHFKQIKVHSFPDGLKEDIIQLIALIRKDQISCPITHKDMKKLQMEKAKYEKEIIEIYNKKEDPLDVFIEWRRYDQQIKRVENEKACKRKEIAKLFDLPAQFLSNSDYAFACYKNSNNKTEVTGCHSVWKHPLDSPLVKIICHVGKTIKKGDVKGFLHLSDKQFSHFERGVIEVFGKSVDSIPTKKDVEFNAAQDVLQDSFIDAGNVEFIPQYGKVAEPTTAPNLHTFTPELEEFYLKLAISLAYHATFDDARKKLQLANGNPVGCVIVSKTGEILSWGVNTIGERKNDLIKHAEVNSLLSFFHNNPKEKFLPEGTRVFISLKSCHMCAGAIHDSTQHQENIHVIYGQNDPNQKNTVIELRENIHLKQVQSPLMMIIKRIDQLFNDLKVKPKPNAAESPNHELIKAEFQNVKASMVHALDEQHEAGGGVDRVLKHIKSFLEQNQIDLKK